MRSLFWVFALAILCNSAAAEEADLPEFERPPNLYAHAHQIGGISRADSNAPTNDRVLDQLLLGDRTKKGVLFHLYAIGTNYHICSLAGAAAAVSTNKYEYRDGNCLLYIEYIGTAVRIKDVGDNCSTFGVGHCGSRASSGTITLTPASLQKSLFWTSKMKANRTVEQDARKDHARSSP